MRHAPATLRNREPILEVLQRVLPQEGLLLEIASGTGEHAAFMAPRLPGIVWQPTDRERRRSPISTMRRRQAESRSIDPAMVLDAAAPSWPVDAADAIFCCNMIHIAPWAAAEGLFAGAARLLPKPVRRWCSTALQAPWRAHRAVQRGLRALAQGSGRALRRALPRHAKSRRWPKRTASRLDEIVHMPANNLTVVWRRV